MTAPETIIMITTLTTSIVSITNAISNSFDRKNRDEKLNNTNKKLDVIHEQTNGGWAAVHQQLSIALGEIVELKRTISDGKSPIN